MVDKLILTVGLPCSGKSTYIEENFIFHKFKHDIKLINKINFSAGIFISADLIKEQIITNVSEINDIIHEDSVQKAEQMLYESIKDMDADFILMDGGGINNNYTARIINKVRDINPNIMIEAWFFDTPIEVCLERMKNRERKVPIDNVYEKNQRLPRCINKLKEICNDFKTIPYFTNKYLFLDMDGTICSYVKPYTDIDGNADFVNGELFKHLDPVYHIISFVSGGYKPENVFILTASPNSIAWEEKQFWLKKYFPFIQKENIYFVGNKDYKHVFLKQLLLDKKINKSDVCVIDDSAPILNAMLKMGVNAIHPSNIHSLNEF